MIYKSIVGKMWLSIVALFIVVLTGLGLFLGQSFEKFYMDMQERNLTTKANHAANIIKEEKDTNTALSKIQLLIDDPKIHVTICGPEGAVQNCSPGMGMQGVLRLSDEDMAKLQKGETVTQQGVHPILGQKMLSVAVPIMDNGHFSEAVKVWAPLEPITETTNKVKEIIIGIAAGGIMLATFLSYILSKRLSRPLVEMNAIASQMCRNDFEGKVRVSTDDEVGRLGTTLNTLSDELKGTMKALSNEKDQLSNILASMTEGVISFSPTGEIIMINPQAALLFDVENNLPVGKKLEECCPIPDIKEIFHEVLDSRMAKTRTVKWQERMLSVRMAPLKDQTGQIRGVVCVVQDVTQEHRLEKMRKDFVANVSHELRNPLFLLQGYGEALLHGVTEKKEERDEIVGIIVDETLRLQRLVNDILDLANLESDKLMLNNENVPVHEIISGILRRYQPVATERNIKIELTVQEGLPAVKVDPDRITQVIMNLMDNAMRFVAAEGKIEIAAVTKGSFVEISIADNGQGITEEDLPYIWERFYKAEKSRNRKAGGTGLGLAIVKKIVETHNGTVSIDSTYGKGTKVTFTLPI